MAISAFTISSLMRLTTQIPQLRIGPPSSASSMHTNCSTKCLNGTQVEKERVLDPSLSMGRRGALSACLSATISLSLSLSLSRSSLAAILEADDDEELLERVKKDREKRIQRQGVIDSYKKEAVYVQDLVYKLSKVGQAIENNDFSAAGSVLSRSSDSDWLQNVNVAFTKLSSSPEEKVEADAFNSSLASLISSVDKNDIESARLAFVSSASALEKWAGLTGLISQLKGL